MKIPPMTTLAIPSLIEKAITFNPRGKLVTTNENYSYLNIDDCYIHQLFPFLQIENIQKPDYFGDDGIGAHISVIYPEENTIIDSEEVDREHFFQIKKLVEAVLGAKTYYILLIESPSLRQIRRKYGLGDQLHFKDYLIGFHITIGFIVN